MASQTHSPNPQGAQLSSGLHSAAEDLRDLLHADVPASAATTARPTADADRGNGLFYAAIVLAALSVASLFTPAMRFRAEEPTAMVGSATESAPTPVAAID